MWIEILNKSYFGELKIKIKTPIRFPVIEPENLKFAYGREKKSQKRQWVYLRTGRKHGKRTGRKRRCQTGGFRNRYDFAYTGRDTINQVGKIAPEIIKQATGQK